MKQKYCIKKNLDFKYFVTLWLFILEDWVNVPLQNNEQNNLFFVDTGPDDPYFFGLPDPQFRIRIG